MRTQAGAAQPIRRGRAMRAGAAWAAAIAVSAAAAPVSAQGQPPAIDQHAGVFDAARGRAVFFGGYDGTVLRNDVWALTVGDSARWDALTPAGTPPAPRFAHAAVYDPVRDRMLVVGGRNTTTVFDEVWALSLAAPPSWTQLFPLGSPGPRPFQSAIYDPVRDRVVVFGGEGPLGVRNDVWVLALGGGPAWRQMAPQGVLPAIRRQHTALYDPVRDRMIVFGGWPPSNDVWSLTFADSTWHNLTPAGAGPAPRFWHTAVYDAAGDRMIAYGGSDGNVTFGDAWALSLSGTPAWTQLQPSGVPPEPRVSQVGVLDPALGAMLMYGGFPLTNEQTWALALAPAPAWSPDRPRIVLPVVDLQLPAVTIGDTVTVDFSVVNDGLRALTLTGFDLPGPEFGVGANPPVRLKWRESASGPLRFAPVQARSIEDSIVVLSDDPKTPRARVTLHVEALGLGFSGRILGTPDQAALGNAMIVVVTPDSAVHIERGHIHYRAGGSGAPFDSVKLVPIATDLIGAIPGDAVTERGVEYWVRAENSGFTATQPPTAPDAFFTQDVAPATVVEAVPRPNSGNDFLAGRAIDVDVRLQDGAVFVSGTLQYRIGGGETFATEPLVTRVPGVPVGTIPAEAVGPRGIEYRVEVNTLESTLRDPVAGTATVRSLVQDLVEPGEHRGERYRLLTVPLDFGVDFSGSLDALLTDQLGTYDPVRWRAFLYDPDSLRNLEFSPARAAAFRPRPGRAFWLVTRDPHRVDTRPVEGLSTPTAAPYPIVLAPGWNLFGNPFDFPVAWADVVRDAGVVGEPVAFDPNAGAHGDYVFAPPVVLVPFEGTFIENVSAGPETLWVPPREAQIAAGARAAAAPGPEAATAAAWTLAVSARTDRAADAANAFGVDARADDAFDPLDRRKPPVTPGPWVRLAFANRAWSAMPGDYRRDVRRAAEAGHVWEVELRSATAGEAVTVEIPAAALPPGVAVRVFDRELGGFVEAPAAGDDGAVPIASARVLSFGPSHPYRLAIVAGDDDFVAHALDPERAVPERLALDPVSPNPFRAAARIRFGLPRATPVTAEVFDVRGARVATLLDGAPLEPGRHALIWDGRDAHRGAASSGVYLLRVTAGGETRTTRLVLVR